MRWILFSKDQFKRCILPSRRLEYDENEELTIIVGSADQLDRMVYDAVIKYSIIFSTAGLKGIFILFWAIDLAISHG